MTGLGGVLEIHNVETLSSQPWFICKGDGVFWIGAVEAPSAVIAEALRSASYPCVSVP